MTLLEQLRAVAASLRDFDHAPDHIEVDTRAVSALLTDAANAIEATTKERDYARSVTASDAEHTARLRAEVAEYVERMTTLREERDAARAEVARLLALATGPKINDEEE